MGDVERNVGPESAQPKIVHNLGAEGVGLAMLHAAAAEQPVRYTHFDAAVDTADGSDVAVEPDWYRLGEYNGIHRIT
jgi:hypothetical protein